MKNALTQPVQVVTLCFPLLVVQCNHGFVAVDKGIYWWLVHLEWAQVSCAQKPFQASSSSVSIV